MTYRPVQRSSILKQQQKQQQQQQQQQQGLDHTVDFFTPVMYSRKQ